MPQFSDGLREERHRDGSLRARGAAVGGEPDGYWEWSRLDADVAALRLVRPGRLTGTWTTYDRSGAPYTVTTMR